MIRSVDVESTLLLVIWFIMFCLLSKLSYFESGQVVFISSFRWFLDLKKSTRKKNLTHGISARKISKISLTRFAIN